MKKLTKAQNHQLNRVAYGIENGNTSRFVSLTIEQCFNLAEQALEDTQWKSLKAARQWLDSKKISYSF